MLAADIWSKIRIFHTKLEFVGGREDKRADLLLCTFLFLISIYLGTNLEISVTHMLRGFFFPPLKQHQSFILTSLELLQVLISQTQHTQNNCSASLKVSEYKVSGVYSNDTGKSESSKNRLISLGHRHAIVLSVLLSQHNKYSCNLQYSGWGNQKRWVWKTQRKTKLSILSSGILSLLSSKGDTFLCCRSNSGDMTL